MFTNSASRYGLVSIGLHWLMALCFFGMYALGWWMVELDYYHGWYHRAPELHKSIGISLVALMLFRFAWNRLQARPDALGKQPMLNRIAHVVHNLFYLFVLMLLISGYLISTAKGKGIEVFELFSIPALLPDNEARGELAGDLHEIFAHLFIAMAVMHAGAALKHHFLDRDRTLVRMLRTNHPNHGVNQ